jgi:hypothetical protein
MPEILIAGCSDSEYSYDAEFDGRPNGAMTALALRVIKQNPDVTYREFYAGLRAFLPSEDYPTLLCWRVRMPTKTENYSNHLRANRFPNLPQNLRPRPLPNQHLDLNRLDTLWE